MVLHVWTGPMFAGKTTMLQREMRRAQAAGKHTLVLRPSMDTRTPACTVRSHDGHELGAVAVEKLSDVVVEMDVDVIGLDECQFWDESLISFCTQMVARGKKVIAVGLDGDAQQRTFGYLSDLLPLSDTFTKLSAVCSMCGADAPFTRALRPVGQVHVGGKDTYQAVCRNHVLG